jgi:hypothetical protein
MVAPVRGYIQQSFYKVQFRGVRGGVDGFSPGDISIANDRHFAFLLGMYKESKSISFLIALQKSVERPYLCLI